LSESERIELADYIQVNKKADGPMSGKMIKIILTGNIPTVREVVVSGGLK